MHKSVSTFIERHANRMPPMFYPYTQYIPTKLLTDEQYNKISENENLNLPSIVGIRSVAPINHGRRMRKQLKVILRNNKGLKTREQHKAAAYLVIKMYINNIINPAVAQMNEQIEKNNQDIIDNNAPIVEDQIVNSDEQQQ